MVPSADEALSGLAARIAAGETIDPASVPAELASQPAVQKLLRFAKVAQSFAGNAGAKPAEPVAPDRIGPWKLLRLLGSGGMGDVWLGERADGTVEHRVAIKRVRGASPAFASRLEAERRILAKLSHPNIARFIDAGVDATGAPWLALDYIDGETLNTWADRVRPSLTERLELFLAICAAVEHAHRHLVVHRDLKPANVLVDADGKPHLLDFGVAKLLDGSGGELTAAALTPAYAAPEQLRGGEVSTATDVYALGLLLFRLLAGELPPTRREVGIAQVLARLDEEETQQPSVAAHAQSLPYPATTLEGDLDAIVSKAIRALPEARYGSVAELAADVRRHLESRPVSARQPTRAYLFGRWVRRNALAVGLGTAAMLALITGTGLALWQAEVAREQRDAARIAAGTSQRVTSFMLTIFTEFNPQARQGQAEFSGKQIVANSIERARVALADDDIARADILTKLAELQALLDSPDAAEPAVAEALEIYLRERGEASVEVAKSRNALAMIRAQQRRWPEVEQLLGPALPVLESVADYDRYAAQAWSLHALAARNLGHSEAAIERLGKALAIARTAYGPDNPSTIEMGGNQAMLLMDARRFDEAEAGLRATIAAYERTQGKQFPRLYGVLAALARVRRSQGDYAEARALFARMAALGESQLGRDNAQFANNMLLYAEFLAETGDWQGAERELDRVAVETFAERPATGAHAAIVRALIALRADRLDAVAPQVAEAMAAVAQNAGARGDQVSAAQSIATLAAALRGDEGGYAASHRAAQDAADDPSLRSRLMLLEAEAVRAAKAGDRAQALAAWDSASAMLDDDPDAMAHQRPLLDLERAEFLVSGDAEDRAAAGPLLDRAVRSLEALGLLEFWRERIETVRGAAS
jgi:serine/threonine-protein kinase